MAGDLGGLLIATLLGVVYLEFMTFVVAWYGDLPDKAAWFLKRAGFRLDCGADHGAAVGRGAAVRNAARQGDPPQPARLAYRRRRLSCSARYCIFCGCWYRPSTIRPRVVAAAVRRDSLFSCWSSLLIGPALAQCWRRAVPNEEMGGRTLPQPPDVATSIVMMAVAGFLGFVALTMAGLFFYLQGRRAERSEASDRTSVS